MSEHYTGASRGEQQTPQELAADLAANSRIISASHEAIAARGANPAEAPSVTEGPVAPVAVEAPEPRSHRAEQAPRHRGQRVRNVLSKIGAVRGLVSRRRGEAAPVVDEVAADMAANQNILGNLRAGAEASEPAEAVEPDWNQDTADLSGQVAELGRRRAAAEEAAEPAEGNRHRRPGFLARRRARKAAERDVWDHSEAMEGVDMEAAAAAVEARQNGTDVPEAVNPADVRNHRRQSGRHRRAGILSGRRGSRPGETQANLESEATDAREYSMLKDWRNWGPAGIAAALTIKASGFRESGEASKAYAMLPEGWKRAVAAFNLGGVAMIAGAAWSGLVRPGISALMSARGYGELPGGHGGTGVIDALQTRGGNSHSNMQLAANVTELAPGNGSAGAGQAGALPSAEHHYLDVSQVDAKGASRIENGEGWYHQLHQMGMSHDQSVDFLNKHGAELEQRGLAYKMGDHSWGMNLGSHPHHDASGTYNNFSADDAKWFHDTAVHDGLLPADQLPAGGTGNGTGPHTGGADGGHPGGDHTGSTTEHGGDNHTGDNKGTDGHTDTGTNNGIDTNDHAPRHGLTTAQELAIAGIGVLSGGAGIPIGREAVRRARAAGLEPGRHRAAEQPEAEAVVAETAATEAREADGQVRREDEEDNEEVRDRNNVQGHRRRRFGRRPART